MVTDRRPRITPELAEKIDTLREEFGIPFERYVNDVLERHVGHALGTPNEDYYRERHGERRHTAEDPGGAVLYIDKDNGEHHDYEGVLGMLAISDEAAGAVGFYMTEAEVRALRDVCTELLGEWEGHR